MATRLALLDPSAAWLASPPTSVPMCAPLASTARRRRCERPLAPPFRAIIHLSEEAIAKARADLGQAVLAAAWNEGRGLHPRRCSRRSPAAPAPVVNGDPSGKAPIPAARHGIDAARELEVLQLVREGCSNRGSASDCTSASGRPVRTSRTSSMKLDVAHRRSRRPRCGTRPDRAPASIAVVRAGHHR